MPANLKGSSRRPLRPLYSLLLWGSVAALGAAGIAPQLSAQPNNLSLPGSTEANFLAMVEQAKNRGIVVPEEAIRKTLQIIRSHGRLHEQMKEEGEDTQSLLSADLWQQVESPLSRTVGKYGIPFPDESQMVWAPHPPSKMSEEAPTPRIVVATPTPYRLPPPRCTRDETVKNIFDPSRAEDTVLLDRLFIPEDMVPFDSQEAFGASVDIVPYSASSEPDVAIRLRIHAVPCLPYRKRITNTTEYFDTGANALRSYDSGYSGKGEWDPVMFQKLYPGKGLPPSYRKPVAPRVRR